MRLRSQVVVGLGVPAFMVHARDGHFTFDNPQDLLGLFVGTVGPQEIRLYPQRPYGGRIEGILANPLGGQYQFQVQFQQWG